MFGKSAVFVFYIFLWNCFLQVNTNHRFGYSQFEQRKWRDHDASCAGPLQSPIKIDSFKAIPLQMPAIELIRYHDLLPGPLQLHNNGHSVSLSIPKLEESDPLYKYIPYVFGGRLTNEYVLEGLHFHWGDTNSMGSEHVFNDVRYPIEMHIIHRNRKYKNVPEALGYRDGLTVLGFFYQIREKDNRQLLPIIKALPNLEEFDSKVQLNETFILASLLPPIEEMERFYTYLGSLTTPPCSEAVTWILFPDPLPISASQMNKFRRLESDDHNTPLINNYRSVQRVGHRRVFVRKLKPKTLKFNPNVHYMKWDWLNYPENL